MHPGLFLLRPLGRRYVALSGLGLLLLAVAGCTPDAYEPSIQYPVRSDWVVATDSWQIQPTQFNMPGHLPLDDLRETLKNPEAQASADQLALKEWIGKKIYDPLKLPAEVRSEYGQALEAMFGTPAQPKVAGLNADALKAIDESLTPDAITKTLDLGETRLAQGSKLYRAQCLHCHGMDGNGRGPTGYWVNPSPRDYREGIFKFTSSSQDQGERKPRRDDLLHIVTTGIEGTSMPSFVILPLEDRQAIVSYVIHLSLRGEAEYATMLDQLKSEKQMLTMPLRDSVKNPKVRDALEDNLAIAVSRWMAAQQPDKAITPTPYPYGQNDQSFLESAARGAKVFLGAGGCIACHQNYGRESNLTYDSWGTIVRGRNLFDGIYRGGRRPLDLYYRIHSGINGAGMTAYKDIKSQIKPEDVGLTPDQFEKADLLWDMVNYLRALGYPELRQALRQDYKVNIPE